MSSPPPADLDAERAVLGCVLVDSERVLDLVDARRITADHFTEGDHRRLYDVIRRLREDGRPVDLFTAGSAAKANGDLDLDRLAEALVEATPTATVAEYSLDRLADVQVRRALWRRGLEAARLAVEDKDNPASDLVDRHLADVEAIRNGTASRGRIEAVDAADLAATEPEAGDLILADTFEAGDKVAIIGSSKARKSFFALQLAVQVSAGMTPFLRWSVSRPRRVLMVQLEIKPAHYHRRVWHLVRALGLAPDALGDRLQVVNGRGHTLTERDVLSLARRHRAELVLFDPLFKLLTGDENLASDVKPALAMFDRIASTSGAAVAYVHHNPKGIAGDKQTRDRGAGSGVLGRDFDSAIYLTDHRDTGLVVLDTLLRNHPPQDPYSAEWRDGRFIVSDAPAVELTSANRSRGGSLSVAHLVEPAVALVDKAGILSPAKLHDLLRSKFGLSRNRERDLYGLLTDADGPLVAWHTEDFPPRYYVGTRDQHRGETGETV